MKIILKQINNAQVDDAKDPEVFMPMFNLVEYGNN